MKKGNLFLYLLESPAEGGGHYYKIGITDSVERRKSQYALHNPDSRLLYVRPVSDETYETRIHLLLEYLGLCRDRYSSKEWFIGDDRVVNIFCYSWSDIDYLLFKHRSSWRYSDTYRPTKKDMVFNSIAREYVEKLGVHFYVTDLDNTEGVRAYKLLRDQELENRYRDMNSIREENGIEEVIYG